MSEEDKSAKIRRALARHNPSAYLLAAQLIQLLLYAIFTGHPSQRALLSALSPIMLVMVVWVLSRNNAILRFAWILAVPAFILSVLSAIFYTNPTLLGWSALLECLLYFLTAGSLIAYMMADYRVTRDEIFAAGATFTLLAWGFAYANLVCQTWVPDSFISGVHPGEALNFVELLSLSFTNLTATGLGDILPISPPARVITMLEQFCGVGYVTLVVSRLIGMSLEKRERRHP